MSDYQQQAESEMWDAIAANDRPPARVPVIVLDDTGARPGILTSDAAGDLIETTESGQTALGVPGEQRQLLPMPDPVHPADGYADGGTPYSEAELELERPAVDPLGTLPMLEHPEASAGDA